MIYKRKFGDKAGQYLTDDDVDMPEKKPVVSVRLYKRIAAVFLGLTMVLLGLMVYLSFTKAIITIVPAKEKSSIDFSVNVEKEPSSRDAIAGTLISVKVQGETEETATGVYIAEDRKATGEVTITNNTSNAQTLIKTTRLLTPAGVLFRLNSAVAVPAKGSVKAQIYADKAGISGEVDPVKMTFPGLSLSLQDKIYAELGEATKIQSETAKAVSKEDIDRAEEKLVAELLEKGKIELASLAPAYQTGGPENPEGEPLAFKGAVFGDEIVSVEYDKKQGEKTENFKVEMELRVVGVFYNQESLQQIARTKMEESMSSESELVNINFDGLKTEVGKFDLIAENAILKIHAEGETIIKQTSQIFDKNKLAGMEKDAAIDYFKTFSAIQSAQIELRPFWLTKIPEVKDNIEIIINK
jgi:hypothetical protein